MNIGLELNLPPKLREQGINKVAIRRKSILIEYQTLPYRFTLTPNDPDKTIRAFEKRMGNVINDEALKQSIIFLITGNVWDQVTDEENENHETTQQSARNNPYADLKPSSSEWQSGLIERYHKLKAAVKTNMSELWESLDFELSISKILNIKGCSLPFGGIVLGSPSSFKTVGIEMFRPWLNSLYTDSFTPKSFVSHNTTVPKEQLAEIDLLPKIKNKILLISELSPIFAKRDDELIELLGILTRVLDGQGYESDSGAHGHRGYTGEFMFVLIGAAVDIPRKVHKHLATLGPKLYFLRLKNTQKSEDDYLTNMKKDDFKLRTDAIKQVLIDYLNWFEACPNAQVESNLVKIEWNAENDEELASRIIVRLGILLSHLRGAVATWETEDSQGLDYAYTSSTIEKPDRAITQLRNLARGHALTSGRNFITLADMPLLIEVVLSTASRERVNVFDLLINNNGVLQTADITSSLNTSDKTAKRTMAEFISLGLVKLRKDPYQRTIELKNDFDWFLSDEFKKLRLSEIGIDTEQNVELSPNTEDSINEPPDNLGVFQACYYCDCQLVTKPEYERHIDTTHSGKPAYPGRIEIEKHGLKPQGKTWEI